MREIMIFDPGDKVKYVGEKPLKVILPFDGAWIAGRPESSPSCRALVEFKFELLPNISGKVVPPPLGEEANIEFCWVRFDGVGNNVIISIAYEDLEIVIKKTNKKEKQNGS